MVRRSDFGTANPKHVVLGTLFCLALSAVPFAFKKVRDKEANVHRMREAQIDAKDNARDARLRTIKKTKPEA
jgi:hypothetical protein